jgi:hypothetical protein
MLAISEISNPAIDPTGPMLPVRRSRLTKSAFGPHAVLNALLVAHPSEPAGPLRTCGAHIAPKASPKRKKRLQPAVAASGFDPFK